MNQTERLYRIDSLLRAEVVVTRARFLAELEVSYATFKRDLAYLRDRLHAPIEFDAERGGYRFGAAKQGPRHAIPGMWFNAEEIYALLTMQELLRQLRPGLLTPRIQPLVDRLNLLLDTEPRSRVEMQRRIRIHRINTRNVLPSAFDPVCMALLNRRQIQIDYLGRGRNVSETRTVSPQRLTYYRDNWYLDAWCHLRNGLRSFSLDAVTRAAVSDAAAREIDDRDIDALSEPGYGIFAGPQTAWATLRFSPDRARWIACEVWHPRQESHTETDGHFVLRVPYSDDRELVMDIMRHMPEVVVLGPPALQSRVRAMLTAALAAAGAPA